MRRVIASLCVASALCCATSAAMERGSGAIVAGRTTIVSRDAPSNPYAETFLAVDPKRPASLIVASLTIGNGALASALYTSQDDGRHWSRVDTGRHYDTADPIVYYAPDGRAFFESERSGGLSIMASDDGGATWRPFRYIRVGLHFDRPYIGFDAQGPFAGRMYAYGYVALSDSDGRPLSGLAVTTSNDGGETFSTPAIIDTADPGAKFSISIPGDVVVTTDGTLLLPYVVETTRRLTGGLERARYDVIASQDGGSNFSKAAVAARFAMPVGGYRGISVLGGVRAAVDMSRSRYRGRVYLVYPNSTATRTDIEIAHSSDDGRTWSTPVRVNDNVGPSDNANAAVWVNGRGVVGVTWNDRRASHGTSCYRIYASASLDGGLHFLRNVPLSPDVTCPSAPGNWKPVLLTQPPAPWTAGEEWLDVLTVATRWPNGGDTQGLQSEPDGTFDAAWIDGASGVMQLAFTRFKVAGSAPTGLSVRRSAVASPRSDLASQIHLNVISGAFDPHSGMFSVLLQLKNISSAPIRGPFAVVYDRAVGNLPNLRATNPDTTRDGHSAWILGDGDLLQPGASTAPHRATWRFSGYPRDPMYPVFIFTIERATS
ncbi:MAG: sialidase family protein [Candidatus Tyrphobacter sp.]